MIEFEFANLDVEITIDPSLPITAFMLTVDTKILRNKVAPTYWRPFQAYHGSYKMELDLGREFRETGNPNEYYYYLNYLTVSPNMRKNEEIYNVKIRANNLLYVFHDLLHSFHDIVGDTMSVDPETEIRRFEQAIDMNRECGFEPFPDKLLEQVSEALGVEKLTG